MLANQSALNTKAQDHDHIVSSISASNPQIWEEALVGSGYNLMTSLSWYNLVNNSLIQLAEVRSQGSVVDVACGTGSATKLIAEVVGPNGQVLGIDPSDQMLAEAKINCLDMPQIVFKKGTVEELTKTLSTSNINPDQIVTFNAMHLFSDIEMVIGAISARLDSEHVFAFSTAFSNQAVTSREDFKKVRNIIRQITDTARKEYPEEMEGFSKKSTAKILNIDNLTSVMQDSNFQKVEFELVPVSISNHDLVVFFSVPGVLDQLLPKTIPTNVRIALIEHAIMETGIDEVNRNWLLMKGIKI